MQLEGVFREMKLRGHYEKPSERRVREKAEAIRRARKLARKKLQRDGPVFLISRSVSYFMQTSAIGRGTADHRAPGVSSGPSQCGWEGRHARCRLHRHQRSHRIGPVGWGGVVSAMMRAVFRHGANRRKVNQAGYLPWRCRQRMPRSLSGGNQRRDAPTEKRR
jgi:small subunit ribosomal protein S21